MDTILNMKAFLATARSGSFSEAARQLSVAPSVDVTGQVLASLNQQLPSVSVTAPAAPAQQQQQQPQGR